MKRSTTAAARWLGEGLADDTTRELQRERADLGAQRRHSGGALRLDRGLRISDDARGIGRSLLLDLDSNTNGTK